MRGGATRIQGRIQLSHFSEDRFVVESITFKIIQVKEAVASQIVSAMDSLATALPHRRGVLEANWRVVIQKPAAAFAEHQLIAFS
jgi:hypothetical protein